MIPWLSSRPAYPDPTPQWVQPSTLNQTCSDRTCDHLGEPWRPDGSPPALIWRGPGCMAAWMVQNLPPLPTLEVQAVAS